jgi:CDP-paratose 2-epimerase
LRELESPPIFLYASTNKVYGNNPGERQLDFKTPYACSKGAAEQYVLDYYHTYGLRTVSFRQSCIYGPHQLGSEDQGWVAWMMRAALIEKPITVYGDGEQVRDILYVDDMIEAYLRAVQTIVIAKGKAYDVGGGLDNEISVNELLSFIESKINRKLDIKYAPARLNDQKRYVSYIKPVSRDLHWSPQVSKFDGLNKMWEWMKDSIAKVEA